MVKFNQFLVYFLVAASLCAYENNSSASLNFGPTMTAVTGSRSLIGINQALIGVSDLAFDKFPSTLPSYANILLRLADMVLVELPISQTLMLIQHEFFGHGSRAREFGNDPQVGYATPPFPYGSGFAFAYPGFNTDPTLSTIGGVTANDVMAHDVGMGWFANREIVGRMGWLYLLNAFETSGYVWIGNLIVAPGTSDIDHFVRDTGASYGMLSVMSVANLFDPIAYNAIYAMYNYVANGKNTSLWSIPMGEHIRYLPSVKMVFSPFGPDFQLHNYMEVFERSFDFFARYGQLDNRQYWGVGINGQAWRYKTLTLGTHLELWQQPYYTYGTERLDPVSGGYVSTPHVYGAMTFGGMGTVQASWRFIPAIALDLELGYKSRGWVQGELFGQSLVARGGVTVYY